MSCKDLEHDLLSFLDNRLEGADRSRVENHLASCAACRAEAESMRRTWKLLGYFPGRNASAKLPENILAAARLQLEVERRWSHRLLKHAPWIASAAIMLVVFTVTVLWRPLQPADPYAAVVAGLDAEEQEVVQNLDLYENLGTVENIDVLEDDQVVEYLDLVSSITDEDF